MLARLVIRNESEAERAERWGIQDKNRIYRLHDLADGEVMIAATGVTDGGFLRGVRRWKYGARTHSVIMRSKSGTMRFIEAQHDFTRKIGFAPLDQA